MGTIDLIFSSAGFMPHGHCFLWKPLLLWSLVGSDLTIAASYFSIPFALWYLARMRPDMPYRWMFILSGLFVMGCGTTHLFSVWNIWQHDYWAEGVAKLVTATVSLMTAVALWRYMPALLRMPSIQELEDANRLLKTEIEHRHHAERKLQEMVGLLEGRVASGSEALDAANISLYDSNKRLQAACEAANLAMFEWNLKTNEVEWLGNTASLTDFFQIEFAQEWREFKKYIHPDDLAGMIAEIERCKSEHVPFFHEYRIICPDGMVHWRLRTGKFQYDRDNAAVTMLGTVLNISERKKIQNELKFKNTLLATQLEASQDAILMVDEAARIQSFNRNFIDLFDVPAETLKAGDDKSLLNSFSDKVEHAESFYARIRYLYEHPEEKSREEIRLRDGRIIDRYSAPVIDPTGNYLGRVWYFRDITKIKLADLSVHRLNRSLTALSRCNNAVIRAEDETRLLNEICRIIVETGGYLIAWVGYAENDPGKTVHPIAHAGYAEGYLERARVSWADDESGSGPVGRAIRTHETQLIKNTLSDPSYQPWKNNAITLGYRSVLAFPLSSLGQTLGAISIYSSEIDGFSSEEVTLLAELADDLAFGVLTLRTRDLHAKSSQRIATSLEGTIVAIAEIVEMRDPYTAGHQHRVATLSRAIAQELRTMSEHDIHGVYLAALVHDLGKIQIPAEVLAKPTRLTALEYEIIKEHPRAGYEILRKIDFPWPIAEIVGQHHERMNGTGYPAGLKGTEISLGARIIAVADTVEAISSHRPYRPGLGIEAALGEIRENCGTLYDPDVVNACLTLLEQKGFEIP